jgi:phage shock protein PspC (stress-responsive transcriptional regulator)
MPTVQIGSGSTPYESTIQTASQTYGVPANLIKAVIKQESGFNPNAHSGAGAAGLMQLMPSTAAGLGVNNVYDPQQSIMGGTKYLAQALKNNNGSVPLALAAYNAGQGAVNKYGGIPPYKETQNYVSSIMSMYGSGNVNVSGISDGSGNMFDIGGNIVNGIQNIFRTLFTDTVKIFLYIILFALMVFFGYKALQGSPPAAAAIQTTKKAGSTTKKIVKTAIKVIPK